MGRVLSRAVRKNVIGISSNESVNASKAEPIMAVLMLGNVTSQNVCQGVEPRSAAASSKYGSRRLRRAYTCVSTKQIRKVVWPITTAVSEIEMPNNGKNDSMATPVKIPGSVMGSNTIRSKVRLSLKLNLCMAKAPIVPMISAMAVPKSPINTLILREVSNDSFCAITPYHFNEKPFIGKALTVSGLKEYSTTMSIGKYIKTITPNAKAPISRFRRSNFFIII